MQQRGEVCQRAAHAERKGDDAHVLDRGVAEQALDVALPPQRERRQHRREQAEHHQHASGQRRMHRADRKNLAADHRIHRHVEQQPRQHRRDRRGTLRVGVGQPVVQRGETDLGAVTDQQKDEREPDHRRIELPFHRVQVGPQQRSHALATEQPLSREVQQDRAKQRQRDTDAAQDEIFPGRLDAGAGAVQRHQQHGRQRRRLHRDPQQPHVVGRQCHQHGGHEQLVHAVIEPQAVRVESTVILFDTHVGVRKHCRGEADQRGQRDQEHVERIDEELLVGHGHRSLADDPEYQRRGGDQRRQADHDVEFGGGAPRTEHGQHDRTEQWSTQHPRKLHVSPP